MRRLVYMSKERSEMGEERLEAILTDARKTNRQLGITGLLVYHDGQFFQCLEGPDEAMDQVLAKIWASAAHQDIVVMLDDRHVSARLFPDWAMGFETDLDRSRQAGFLDLVKARDALGRLVPFETTGPSAIASGAPNGTEKATEGPVARSTGYAGVRGSDDQQRL